MQGKKFDTGKPPLGLVHGVAITEIAKVLQYGAEKYDRHNWLAGMKWSRVYDALLRHTYAWIDGEDLDEETNLSHLAHMGCCIMFLIVYEKLGIGEDDRYKPKKKESVDNLDLQPIQMWERGHLDQPVKVCAFEQLMDAERKLSREEQIECYVDMGYSRDQSEEMVDLLENPNVD